MEYITRKKWIYFQKEMLLKLSFKKFYIAACWSLKYVKAVIECCLLVDLGNKSFRALSSMGKSHPCPRHTCVEANLSSEGSYSHVNVQRISFSTCWNFSFWNNLDLNVFNCIVSLFILHVGKYMFEITVWIGILNFQSGHTKI